MRSNSSCIDLKNKYLEEAIFEATTSHPENNPVSLLCPISGDFMLNPVITPEGFVYDREFIIKSIAIKKQDPQSRSHLSIKDLTAFPELIPIIAQFSAKKAHYLELKKKLIQEARAIAHPKLPPENPALFLCPISKQLIQKPVITSNGKVYDKQSLIDFLKSTGNKDEKGKALSLDDVVDFDEFFQQIKVYKFYRSKEEQSISPMITDSSYYSFFIRHLTSWFSSNLNISNKP